MKFARTAMLQRSKAADQSSAEYQAQALRDEATTWAVLLDGVPFEEAQAALVRVVRGWTSDKFGLPKPGDVLAEVEQGRRARARVAWAERELADARADDSLLDERRFWLGMSRRDDVSVFVREHAQRRLASLDVRGVES